MKTQIRSLFVTAVNNQNIMLKNRGKGFLRKLNPPKVKIKCFGRLKYKAIICHKHNLYEKKIKFIFGIYLLENFNMFKISLLYE